MNPLIVIVGQPAWLVTATQTLSPDFRIHHQIDTIGYMQRLIDDQATLIFVDGDTEGWDWWVSTPKVSSATRRIPIIVISDQSQIRAEAPLHGADFAYTPAELAKNIGQWARDYARIPSPELIEELACDCAEPLPPLAVEGLTKFNQGAYYQQHDLLEEQWMLTERPVRDLYRAVLQVGIAYFQIERGNYRGAMKMLQRSVQWLLLLPDTCQGVNVKQLREDSFRVRAELERLGEARFAEFDRTYLRPVQWEMD